MVAQAAPRGRAGAKGRVLMSNPSTRFVEVWGGKCRIVEAGEGPRVGVLPGHGGLPRWTPFLDRLCRAHRVVLLSLPGFPGSNAQHEEIDSHTDWICATLDLLEEAELGGADLLASSTAAMLAAEVAVFAPGFVRKLSLAGPYGIFDSNDPTIDFFAHTPAEMRELLCKHPARYDEAFAEPDRPAELAEWRLAALRAQAASARFTWPLGDKGLRNRLHRLTMPVQIVWGREDRLIPPAYAEHFEAAMGRVADKTIVDDAGHLVWVDRPEESAAAILRFLER
jgi:pimeloyl-ACP methyl ester carboxylesterase